MTHRVIYHSVTGSTRKIAREIASALGGSAEEAAEITAPLEADVIYVGGACYKGRLHPKLIACIRTLNPKQVGRAVLFATGFPQTSAVDRMRSLLTEQGIPVHGETFISRGRFLLFNWSHPDAEDCKAARDFALRSFADVKES